MIISDKGDLKVEGDIATIMAEFTGIIRGLDGLLTEAIGKDMSEKFIMLAGRRAFNNTSIIELLKEIV